MGLDALGRGRESGNEKVGSISDHNFFGKKVIVETGEGSARVIWVTRSDEAERRDGLESFGAEDDRPLAAGLAQKPQGGMELRSGPHDLLKTTGIPGLSIQDQGQRKNRCVPEISGDFMTSEMLNHIPLNSAYLCQDCDAVGNSSMQCPACASEVLMGLAGVFARKEEVAESNMFMIPAMAA